MSFFDGLLKSRNLSICITPLWQLKITDSEYEELRSLLKEIATTHRYSSTYGFPPRETALFFAEFWRREYSEGTHSKQMVFDALNTSIQNLSLVDDFYYAACRGAKLLNIECYEGARSDMLDSMLYQGGIPMRLVTQESSNSAWGIFIRGLIFRNINFDNLSLGVVARQSKSLRNYCTQLCNAVDDKQFVKLPFFCENEANSWYQFLIIRFKEERARHREIHPFSIEFEFIINHKELQMGVRYNLIGPQKIPNLFLEQNDIKQATHFSVQSRTNGKAVDTFDYYNAFCRYEVHTNHKYHINDTISLYISDKNGPYLTEFLNMESPHLLFQNKRGNYELGNRIGSINSLLLFPTGWHITGKLPTSPIVLQWDGLEINALPISADFDGTLSLQGEDGSFQINRNAVEHWTETATVPLNQPLIIEPVFNANITKFRHYKKTEDGDKLMGKLDYALFRSKWEKEWHKQPPYGTIVVKAVDSNCPYINPATIVNVGNGLSITIIKADNESCLLRVVWPYGKVTSLEGTHKGDDSYEINKCDCADSRHLHFRFTPFENGHNVFELSVIAPFRDFSLTDIDGKLIENGSYIPFSDIDQIQYHLVGQNAKITIETIEKQILWERIPHLGSLTSLLGSRDFLDHLLRKTSQNMINACIPISIRLDNRSVFNYLIKESPFIPEQIGNSLIIKTKEGDSVHFTKTLKLYRLDNPNEKPLSIRHDNEKGYIIPDEIKAWGNTLVIGHRRGQIRPALVNLNCEMSYEERKKSRLDNIIRIQNELQNAPFRSQKWENVIGWFHIIQKEDIPASSILEFVSISQDDELLFKLAFHLFLANTQEEDGGPLSEQLLCMGKDLAIQWFWLLPTIKKTRLLLNCFLDVDSFSVPAIRYYYAKWAFRQTERISELGLAFKQPEHCVNYIMDCYFELADAFEQWLKELCYKSMVSAFPSVHQCITEGVIKDFLENKTLPITEAPFEYVETNQAEALDDQTCAFFDQFSQPGTSGNEQWMLQRVNALTAHINGSINLFHESEMIRRSLIYCYNSCIDSFIISLNNKLCK